MKMTEEWSCSEFAAHLAAQEPAPGGGAAAALCGALGAALGQMAASYTVDKTKYADRRPLLQKLLAELEGLRCALLCLVDDDAACYQQLNSAYALPKNTAEEQTRREAAIAAALPAAMRPAQQVMELSAAALNILDRLADGNCTPPLLSDVGCAASLCRAALETGSLNLFVNSRAMKYTQERKDADRAAQMLLDTYLPLADGIVAQVRGYLLG